MDGFNPKRDIIVIKQGQNYYGFWQDGLMSLSNTHVFGWDTMCEILQVERTRLYKASGEEPGIWYLEDGLITLKPLIYTPDGWEVG